MAAAKYHLDNLCAIVDVNGLQIDGATADVMPSEPLDKKFEAFNWNVIPVDGHDFNALEDAFARAGDSGLLVLDEAVGACASGMIDEARLLALLGEKPGELEVVLTGRGPSQALMDAAGYVTEMVKRKHPFDQGVPARKGIEF